MVEADFWKDRAVLITGHTGFKGAWLSLWLHSLGAKVSGYSLEPSANPSMFECCNIMDLLTYHIIGNVKHLDDLKSAVTKTKPEIVFHMAAQSLVSNSYSDPVETYSTNVMGTVNLLEALRSSPSVRAIVVVTSDKCYEDKNWEWGYRENDRLGGFDPYASSKACAELVTSAYINSYFNPSEFAQHRIAVASARAGNVIGGGDWATNRLVPDLIRALLDGHPLKIRNPNALRP